VKKYLGTALSIGLLLGSVHTVRAGMNSAAPKPHAASLEASGLRLAALFEGHPEPVERREAPERAEREAEHFRVQEIERYEPLRQPHELLRFESLERTEPHVRLVLPKPPVRKPLPIREIMRRITLGPKRPPPSRTPVPLGVDVYAASGLFFDRHTGAIINKAHEPVQITTFTSARSTPINLQLTKVSVQAPIVTVKYPKPGMITVDDRIYTRINNKEINGADAQGAPAQVLLIDECRPGGYVKRNGDCLELVRKNSPLKAGVPVPRLGPGNEKPPEHIQP
jgi:hypothetical protein